LSSSTRLLPIILFAVSCIAPAAALAQTPERSLLQTEWSGDFLQDLPGSVNVFSILETTQQQITSDRFYTGGLSTGQPARIGGQLASPAQNLFRIGDVTITDPDGSGAPLLFPELQYWRALRVFTGAMPAGVNAPGLAISLEPRTATGAWAATVEASGSPGWVAGSPPGPPPIVSLDTWGHAHALAGGSLISDRVTVMLGAGWTRGAEFVRERPQSMKGTVGSGFAHLAFTPTARDAIRALVWVQQAEYPWNEQLSSRGARDTGVHLQSSWERRQAEATSWRLFGGVTRRSRVLDAAEPSLLIERLTDGPVPEQVPWGHTVTSLLSTGARITPAARALGAHHHATQLAADLERSTGQYGNPFTGWVGERIDGIPARAWLFTAPGGESRRSTTFLSASASDEFDLASHVTVGAGVRVERLTGSAAGAALGVTWQSLLPDTHVRWRVSDRHTTSIFSTYRRIGDRLLLPVLAVGDPAAPTASVFRWDSQSSPLAPPMSAPGPLVARVGPGTSGDPSFSRIAPNLHRPITDEWTIGVDMPLVSVIRWQLAGIARWEHDDLMIQDVGVGTSGYSMFTVPNPGGAYTGPSKGATAPIPVYNRLPASFGLDRYELVNSPLQTPRVLTVDLSFYAHTPRLEFTLGGTAQLGDINAAYRGYRATENDQGVLGDVLSDPNSTTFAYGRPFLDRGFTGKMTVVYRLPKDLRLGVIARYQDGQPFAGLIVVPNLQQGADVVRAFENGGTRFTYVGTLDVRLQRRFTILGRSVDAILDGYNATHFQNEVEERAVIGPGFRSVTAIQPPLAIHVGARVEF
jgi:hypothetical protein